jgi:hypothetical protein
MQDKLEPFAVKPVTGTFSLQKQEDKANTYHVDIWPEEIVESPWVGLHFMDEYSGPASGLARQTHPHPKA